MKESTRAKIRLKIGVYGSMIGDNNKEYWFYGKRYSQEEYKSSIIKRWHHKMLQKACPLLNKII